jgi:hypothetical protein
VTPVARAIAARWRELVDHGDGRLDVIAAHHGLGIRRDLGLQRDTERTDEGTSKEKWT